MRIPDQLPEDLSDPIFTAFHEAGHAAAYIQFGRPFRYVTIRARTPNILGRVAVNKARYLPAWEMALIAAAGPAAEAHLWALHETLREDEGDHEDEWTDRERPLAIDLGTASILRDSQDAHSELLGAERLAKGTIAVMPKWIRGQWDAIEPLALALLDSPRALTWQECHAIVPDHLQGRIQRSLGA